MVDIFIDNRILTVGLAVTVFDFDMNTNLIKSIEIDGSRVNMILYFKTPFFCPDMG